MTDKEKVTAEFLKDFFEEQIKKGMQNFFLETLEKDFKSIMDEFGKYVVDHQLRVEHYQLDFNDIIGLIIQEVCSIKLECVRAHCNHLLQNAAKSRMESRIIGH